MLEGEFRIAQCDVCLCSYALFKLAKSILLDALERSSIDNLTYNDEYERLFDFYLHENIDLLADWVLDSQKYE